MNTRVSCFVFLFLTTVCLGADSNPLFTAIRNNELTAIRSLSAKPALVNALGDRGTTPLLYAAAYGSVDALGILLDAGADPNIANEFGATPLMWAVTEPAKVRLLLARGASVNQTAKTGRTPLMLAAMHNGSSDVVTMLLAKGADPKPADKGGLTFLLAAAAGANPDQVKIAVAKGADVNPGDSTKITALMQAAGNGDLESVRFLLSKGADVNAVSSGIGVPKVKNGAILLGNFTPLILASAYGPPEVVDSLLRAGAKVDAKDLRGMTALHYAVSTEAQHPEIVRLLLKAGADPTARTDSGESASQWAAKFSVPGVIGLLPAAMETRSTAEVLRREPVAGISARTSAERGLRLLEKVSGQFLNTGGCFSCHAQNLTALAASYARAKGLPVDENLQKQQLAGVKGFFASAGDQLLLRFDPPGSADTIVYTLLHFSAAGQKSDPAVDPLIHNLIGEQMANGSWHRGGVARAPMEDSDIIPTALAIRAIRQFAWEGRKADLSAHVESAHAWLRQAKPRYNEEMVMQLLGLKWAGETDEQVAALTRKLVAQQREDGGWSQNPNLTSDAYATGQTLVALSESGMAPSSPAFRRGVQFLLAAQHSDGSWQVKSRSPKFQPYFQSGFPYDHDQWISMAGTAWATIALTLSEPHEQVARAATSNIR